MGVSTLIYGQKKTRILSVDMKSKRYVRGCTKADKIRNETIRCILEYFLD